MPNVPVEMRHRPACGVEVAARDAPVGTDLDGDHRRWSVGRLGAATRPPARERASERLTAKLGRPPTIDEVADTVGAAREAVLEARGALGAYNAGSLEDSCSGRDDDDPLLSVLGCDETGYDRVEQRVLLGSMRRCLTRREREVVRLRFEHDLTQTKISQQIGISQMQVSRILRQSLDRLREVLTEQDAAARDEIPRVA
jgi:RNA polymerase sigma-B factor